MSSVIATRHDSHAALLQQALARRQARLRREAAVHHLRAIVGDRAMLREVQSDGSAPCSWSASTGALPRMSSA